MRVITKYSVDECIGQCGRARAFCLLLICICTPVQADLQTIDILYGPPYRVETVYGKHRPYSTVEGAINARWEGWQVLYGIGPPACNLDVVHYA
ncbi:MAG: hypothetical protein WBO57_00135, partial [Gammaproteobacteria bacterium]